MRQHPYDSPPQVEALEENLRQTMRDHPLLTRNGFWTLGARSQKGAEFVAARLGMLDEDFTRQVIDVAFYLVRHRLPRGKACAASTAAAVQIHAGRAIEDGAVLTAAFLAGLSEKFGCQEDHVR